MKKVLAVLTLLMLAVLPLRSQETVREAMPKAHQKVYDAALALYIDEGDGPRFTCSTTVIGHAGTQYLLLTAGHCVLGDGRDPSEKYFVTEEIIPNPPLQPVTVYKAANDDKLDFALLLLESKKKYPMISIESSDAPPKIEDSVYTVNYSDGLAKQVALGKVSSNPMTTAAVNGQCTPCEGRYLIHLFNGPGSSGAAIIDKKHNRIVGIVELGFDGTIGTAAETMKAYREFLKNTKPWEPSPKVLRLHGNR